MYFNIGVAACIIVNIVTIVMSILTILNKGFHPNAMQMYDSNITGYNIAEVFGAIIFCYDINGVLTEIRAET